MIEVSSFALVHGTLIALQKAIERASNPALAGVVNPATGANFVPYTLAGAHSPTTFTTVLTMLATLGDCGQAQNNATGVITGTYAPCASDAQCPAYGFGDTTCYPWKTFVDTIGLAAVDPTACPVASCPVGMNVRKEVYAVQTQTCTEREQPAVLHASSTTRGFCAKIVAPNSHVSCGGSGACNEASNYAGCTCTTDYPAPWRWIPPPGPPPFDATPIIAGCVGGAVGLVVLAGLVAWCYSMYKARQMRLLQAELIAKRKGAMGAQGAAEDRELPSGEFTMFDTDVESSTALWEWSPKFMSASLLLHDEVLRSNLTKFGGIELLTEGDAFLVAFTDALKGCEWALAVQDDLLNVKWPSELASSGNESSATVDVQGTTIFRGLRVRMGGHCDQAVDKASGQPAKTVSQIDKTDFMRVTRSVSDFALGGQILVSNAVMVKVKQLLDPHTDVAAIGAIQNLDSASGNDENDDAPQASDTAQICVVQLLPASLKKRLPEFIMMYSGSEEQVRPPSGEVTCAFTYCQDGKKLLSDNSPLGIEMEKVDDTLQDIAEKHDGYLCKGAAGKFLFVFDTPDKAIAWAGEIQVALMGLVHELESQPPHELLVQVPE
jgi:class 3 adenylate cyclase